MAPKVGGNLAVVIAFALAQRGEPYRFGAAGPGSWDCSGLVSAAFATIGIRLPHSAVGIGTMGRFVPRAQWYPGVVLAYGGHVSIYLGGGLMVHAPHPGTVVQVSPVYGNPSGRGIG